MAEVKLVRDLMTVGVPTCKLDTPAVDIARYLLQHDLEGMCVLDADGNGVGVVGVDELVAAYDRLQEGPLLAEEIMREGLPVLQADMSLPLAVQFMRDQKTRIAYLTHNAAGIIYPAAYLTYRHLLRHLAARSEHDLKDLGIAAARRTPIEVFMERRDAARRKAGLT